MKKTTFRKLKTAWALTENTVIATLLALGYTNESLLMLLFKIGSSYLLNMLDVFWGEEQGTEGRRQRLAPVLVLMLVLVASCGSTKTTSESRVIEQRETVTSSAIADSTVRYHERNTTIRDTAIVIKERYAESQLNVEEQQVRSIHTGRKVPVYKEQREKGITAWIAIDTTGNIRYGARTDSFAFIVSNLVHRRDSITGLYSSLRFDSISVKEQKSDVYNKTTEKNKQTPVAWLLRKLPYVVSGFFLLWLIGSAWFRSRNPFNWFK